MDKWFTPRRRVIAFAGFLGGGVLAGAAMWVTADDGTKAVDLGAGLIASGAFGFMLLVLERALTARLEETAMTASALSPTQAETKDAVAPTSMPQTGLGADSKPPHAPALRPFTALFAGWARDEGRIDASQVRVRVYLADTYFQFFTGVVSGPALRTAVHGSTNLTLDQYKRGCGSAMVRAIQNAIEIGGLPLDDPTDAVEVLVDSKLAAEFATNSSAIPLEEGDELGSWVG